MIPEFGITLGAILGLASFISILGGSPVLAAATAAMGIVSLLEYVWIFPFPTVMIL